MLDGPARHHRIRVRFRPGGERETKRFRRGLADAGRTIRRFTSRLRKRKAPTRYRLPVMSAIASNNCGARSCRRGCTFGYARLRATANQKVNELVEGLGVAIVIVIALIALTLGWREGFIVATAVPITFALVLLVNYLAGYTINRVTLFALILALGLVVDDPIVDVENIYRHLRMGRQKPLQAVLTAVNEVRPPIILATLAVIVSFIPMFFITGMMGPYMGRWP